MNAHLSRLPSACCVIRFFLQGSISVVTSLSSNARNGLHGWSKGPWIVPSIWTSLIRRSERTVANIAVEHEKALKAGNLHRNGLFVDEGALNGSSVDWGASNERLRLLCR